MNRKEFKGFIKHAFSRQLRYSWSWKRKVISLQGNVTSVTDMGRVNMKNYRKIQTRPYGFNAVLEKA